MLAPSSPRSALTVLMTVHFTATLVPAPMDRAVGGVLMPDFIATSSPIDLDSEYATTLQPGRQQLSGHPADSLMAVLVVCASKMYRIVSVAPQPLKGPFIALAPDCIRFPAAFQ